MFTKNGNLLKGVVNGATTTIKSIIFDPQNNVTTIEVQLTNNSTKMIIKKCSFQHKYMYNGYYNKTSFFDSSNIHYDWPQITKCGNCHKSCHWHKIIFHTQTHICHAFQSHKSKQL